MDIQDTIVILQALNASTSDIIAFSDVQGHPTARLTILIESVEGVYRVVTYDHRGTHLYTKDSDYQLREDAIADYLANA